MFSTMLNKYLFLVFVSIGMNFIFSCKHESNKKYKTPSLPNGTKAALIVIDSLPKNAHLHSIPIKKIRRVRAGKPVTIPYYNNRNLAGEPAIIFRNKPIINTPGTDPFLPAQDIYVSETPFTVNLPPAKAVPEMAFKNPNPSGFGYFNKLHGLRNSIVTALLEDKIGNIWICTASGISKYDGHSFINFTSNEGLVNNDIRCILQDQSGNIWFGGLGCGVTKYDGYSFVNFSVKNGLCNNNILSIAEDKNGSIWFGSLGGGISRYQKNILTSFTNKQGLINDSVNAIVADKKGNVWFGTSQGISMYNGHSFMNYSIQNNISFKNVYTACEDKLGNIWFGTDKGLIKHEDSVFMKYTHAQGLVSDEVFNIMIDKNNNTWIGTHYGISKFDGSSFTNFTENQGLVNSNIYAMIEDRVGNIWIATGGGGVAKYNPHSFSHITESEGLSKNFVFSVLEDKYGKIWVGTWRGGLSVYDGKSFKIYTDRQGLPHNDIRSICEDRYGNLWLATFKGVAKFDGNSFIYFTEKEGLVNNDVNCIKEDKTGNLWFGTENGVSKFDGKSFTNFTQTQVFADNPVLCIVQDSKENLLFGTSKGLFRYDNQKLEGLKVGSELFQINVTSILEIKGGNLLLGTDGKGIFEYNGQSVIQFTENDGLVSNNVTSILQDKLNNLWIGTRYGLSKMAYDKWLFFEGKAIRDKEKTFLFKNYNYNDNFLGIGCYTNAILQSQNGNIWIGTNGGLTHFNPAAETKDTVAPNIQITAVRLENDNIAWTKLQKNQDTVLKLSNGKVLSDFNIASISKWYNLPAQLSLAYNNNNIGFDFAGIDMHQPQNIEYQYRLEGLHNNWEILTKSSNVSYSNLAPGKYSFIVKAVNSDGFWSHECIYSFTIRKPWWYTTGFLLLAIISFTGIGFLIIRFIYLHQLQKERHAFEKKLAVQYERQRISSDLHDEIGATLSSINIYAELAKNGEHLNNYLDSIRQNVNEVIRSLDDLIWSINPKNDSLVSIIDRVYAYAMPIAKAKNIEFKIENKTINFNQEIAADIKNHLYLITKELINNSIKHSACESILILFTGEKKSLGIVVQDDGVGVSNNITNTHRNGMKNMTERVHQINGTMQVLSKPGTGTKVIIHIPRVI